MNREDKEMLDFMIKQLKDKNTNLTPAAILQIKIAGKILTEAGKKAELAARILLLTGKMFRTKSPTIMRSLEKLITCTFKECANVIEAMSEQEQEELMTIFKIIRELTSKHITEEKVGGKQ